MCNEETEMWCLPGSNLELREVTAAAAAAAAVADRLQGFGATGTAK